MAERTVVTKVTNAVLYSDGAIRIDKGRMSYPHIGEPVENDRDNGTKVKSFSVDLLLPKETHKAAKDLIKASIDKLLKEKDDKIGSSFWFLKDGDKLADEAAENGKDREILRGHWVVRAADTRRPSARDTKGNVVTPEEAEELFVGGKWANILIRPWHFNGKGKDGKTYNKRIGANLIAIQRAHPLDGYSDDTFGDGRISDDGVFEAEDGGSSNTGFEDDDDL